MILIKKFEHPKLGEIGIDTKFRFVIDEFPISAPHPTEKDALVSLENYVKAYMSAEENSVFLELKNIQDLKYSKLTEFEII